MEGAVTPQSCQVQGQGQDDVSQEGKIRVCGEWLQWRPGLFLRGTGAVCSPSGWAWPLPATLSRWGTLTEVGELHSLTDWQVSEASEDAELEDFCHAEAGRQGGRRRGENRSGHRAGMQWAVRLGVPALSPAPWL